MATTGHRAVLFISIGAVAKLRIRRASELTTRQPVGHAVGLRANRADIEFSEDS